MHICNNKYINKIFKKDFQVHREPKLPKSPKNHQVLEDKTHGKRHQIDWNSNVKRVTLIEVIKSIWTLCFSYVSLWYDDFVHRGIDWVFTKWYEEKLI